MNHYANAQKKSPSEQLRQRVMMQKMLGGVFDWIEAVQEDMLRDRVWLDGAILMTDDEEIYHTMTSFFRLFSFDFESGEKHSQTDHYFLDFAFYFGAAKEVRVNGDN